MSRTATAAPACEVCAVVPADTAAGDGDGGLQLVPHEPIAALVLPVSAAPARTTQELLAHSRLLDRLAAAGPLLPMRFGTVLASPQEVVSGLLAPHRDRFASALATLAGRAQFALRARYVPEAVVREVLTTDPALLRMHQRLREAPGRADQPGRVALGEAVAARIAASRRRDAEIIAQTLRPYGVMSDVALADAPGGYRLADAALLVELAQQVPLERAVEELGRQWQGRVKLRLLGPMAAYHFADRLASGGV